jgi:hypothetical protein
MKHWLTTVSAGALLALGAACAAEAPRKDETVSFLAFGDSGYHLDYIDEEDVVPPRATRKAFADAYRAEWAEDKKPMRDFRVPPATFLEDHGSYITATGMMPVAKAMKQVCAATDCGFAVMLGDNIYPDGATMGTDGKDDATRFRHMFEEPFGDLGGGKADFKTYVTLGNHDWNTSREGAMAQVAYMEQHPAFHMDGLVYRVKPANAHGLVELFIVDTELMLGGTTVYDAKLADDGSEIRNTELDANDPWAMPQTALEKNQVAWLENALKSSDAKWKFVIAHHPVWASGGSKFEQGHALRKILTPVMCRYADAAFFGHEHSVEIHDDTCAGTGAEGLPVLPNLTSGAASKQRGMNSAFMAYQNRTYPEKVTHFVRGMVWGFMHVGLEGDDATVTVYTTPDDQSGAADEVFTYRFRRRSHLAQ